MLNSLSRPTTTVQPKPETANETEATV